MTTTTDDAAQAGHDQAVTTITRQADAGMTPDQIADHQHDVSAWLLTEAETPDAHSFAAAYDNAAQALAADLMQDARQAGTAPMAATLPDGTPHADPRLAARGWIAEGGVYVGAGRIAARRQDEDPILAFPSPCSTARRGSPLALAVRWLAQDAAWRARGYQRCKGRLTGRWQLNRASRSL